MGTWPVPVPAPSGVCIAGHRRVSLSQLCGGRAPAGCVRWAAAFPQGGAWGVAAVCRRPGKDPPRQFGERAFPGLPWMPAWLCGLVGQLPVCAAASGVVYAPAPTALGAASKAQPRRLNSRPPGGGVRSGWFTDRRSWLSRSLLCMDSVAQDRRIQAAMRPVHSSLTVEP